MTIQKFEDDYEIKHVKGLNGTDAISLAYKGLVELEEENLLGDLNQSTALSWDYDAFIGYYSGIPVSVLIYSYIEWKKSVTIVFGYTLKSARGNRYYSRLWDALVLKAQELKAIEIIRGADPKNQRMVDIILKQGGKQKCLLFSHPVPEIKEEVNK